MVRNEIPTSEYFSPLRNGSELNSEHFYHPRNSSEQNYEVHSVFFFYEMVRNGILNIFIFRGMFCVQRNIFLSENGYSPISNSLLTHVQIFNDDVSAYLFPSWLNFFLFSFFSPRPFCLLPMLLHTIHMSLVN
jgi:hypothetical protein